MQYSFGCHLRDDILYNEYYRQIIHLQKICNIQKILQEENVFEFGLIFLIFTIKIKKIHIFKAQRKRLRIKEFRKLNRTKFSV